MVAGLVALGPGLGAGSLLNLDLVVTPRVPVPAGVWGLGPDLPRRVPFGLLLSWASAAGGPLGAKLVLAACVAAAVAGAIRLVPDRTPWPIALGAGVLYGLSPFALTRLATGQWGVLAAMAVLPFAVVPLLDPLAHPGRTFRWALALALTGVTGGSFAAVLALAGVARRPWRPAVRVALLVGAAQAVWVVPALAVVGTGPTVAPSAGFRTGIGGWWDAPALLAGQGFWRSPGQVGRGGAGALILGLALAGLAAIGHRRLPAWRNRALAVAGAGLAAALASTVPGVRAAYSYLTGSGLLTPFREGERLMPLALVWLVPAAAAGAHALATAPDGDRSGRRWAPAAPAVIGLALAIPAVSDGWAVLQPVRFPPSWQAVRAATSAGPGTVLALPYHEYLDISFAGGRRVLNPLPDYLGGDVIASRDPEIGPPHQEGADPRDTSVARVISAAASGAPLGPGLDALGVRWVVLIHEADWATLRSVAGDPALRPVERSPQVDLYAVVGWRADVTDAAGRPLRTSSPVAPLRFVAGSGPALWRHPAQHGWLRGWRSAGRTASGLISLPAGGGPVWYWPSVVVICTDILLFAAFVWSRRWRDEILSPRTASVTVQPDIRADALSAQSGGSK